MLLEISGGITPGRVRDEANIVLITSGTKFLSKGERQLTHKKENSVPPLKVIMLPGREHREVQASRNC